MMRGQQKCMVFVQNKNEEDIIVPPDCFRQTFKEIGVTTGCDLTLHEYKNFNLSDAGEGGEDENEEMEEEQDEEVAAVEAVEEKKPETDAIPEEQPKEEEVEKATPTEENQVE